MSGADLRAFIARHTRAQREHAAALCTLVAREREADGMLDASLSGYRDRAIAALAGAAHRLASAEHRRVVGDDLPGFDVYDAAARLLRGEG